MEQGMAARDVIGTVPIIVFGAFDRHNFGDLLFPHIAAALLQNEQVLYAGLAERDLRAYGGHRVHSLRQLALRMRQNPVHILHAGGELLTCSAWEAAIMLLSDVDAKQVLARCGADAAAQQDWARGFLGMADLAPYTAAQALFPQGGTVVYNAVGGIDLAQHNPGLRNEVTAKLAQADYVAVRDRHTLSRLHASGIDASLLPDPAVMVADLFSDTIARRARHGETGRVRTTFPCGYLAVQCSADFGAPFLLAHMAGTLRRAAAAHHCGIVLFRAGIAPWHDDLAVYQQLAAYLQPVTVHIFQSLDIWDICALIANSRAYCGSSLHGRIIALAFGRPRMTLRHPLQPSVLPTKHDAFVQTWEDSRLPGVLALEKMEEGLHTILNTDTRVLLEKAAELTMLYRNGFNALRRHLTGAA
jgi:hypothetical protein